MTSRIDDSDPYSVKLDGSWGLRESRSAFENTVAVSDRISDKITVNFTGEFDYIETPMTETDTQSAGTAVEVWGSAIASNQAGRVIVAFDFFIDSQFEQRYSQQIPLELELQIMRLWASRELPFGNHTIELEIFELENAIAVIDYFQVFASGEPPLDVASGVSSNRSPSTAVDSTATSTQTHSSNAAQSSSGTARIPTGPIAGGVIGSILLLALLGLAFFCIRRRHRRRERDGDKLMPFDKLADTPVPIPIFHTKERPYAAASPAIPAFTPPQPKIRSPDNSLLNPLLTLPQPKIRTPADHHPSSPASPSSPNPPSPIVSGDPGPSRVTSMHSTRISYDPEDHSESLQVSEAIRTLQTYLQRQPEGLGHVVQGLGVSTSSDGAEALRSPPPAYEERR
jgi:hypothetical protein